MKNCDIIIHANCASDSLEKCIESILKNTDLQNNRLVIICDKSADEKAIAFAETCTNKKIKNVLLIKSEESLTLEKAANIGIKLSDDDVLLLSPGTEATKGWLEKIQRCAYSAENIATSTPLSSSVPIASIPNYAGENEIPKGYDLESFQSLIDRASYRDYPEIPAGNGRCLFIKREALDNAGFFDEGAYGEWQCAVEDFCYRCLNRGYRHALCDDAVVYSKSGQLSLGNCKSASDEKLKAKYPFYKEKTDKWHDCYPLEYINKNIGYNLCLNNHNANILVLVHAWEQRPYDHKDIGGATLHAYDLIKGLASKYNFHVLAPYNGVYCLCSYWETGEESVTMYSTISDCYFNGLFSAEYSKMLEGLIRIFNIGMIHIQHMVGHYFDIINILSKKKIPLLISLHDLYSICPLVNRIDCDGKYCISSDEAKCSYCLSRNGDIYAGIKLKKTENTSVWKGLWGKLFSYADSIVAPSEAEKGIIISEYGYLNIDVIEHGIDASVEETFDIGPDTEFNVAFIGCITKIKGKKIIEELIHYASRFNDNIHFHLFGHIDSSKSLQAHKNFTYHGPYYRNHLSKLFNENNIKLVCIFSIWPESYSYTLAESIANNVPVLAMDIGAVGERVKKNKSGWLLKTDASIPEIYQAIKDIFKDKEGYRNVVKSVSENKPVSIAGMCSEYDKLYSAFKLERKKIEAEKLRSFLKTNYLYSVSFEMKQNAFGREKKEISAAYEEVIAGMLSSNTWRIGRFLTWFPRKIKDLIKQNRV